MTDRDDTLQRAVQDAQTPRPLPAELRTRLETVLRSDADARLATLLQAAADPRPLDGSTRSALLLRLAGMAAGARPLRLSRRLTVALASAAAAVALVGGSTLLLRPGGDSGSVAQAPAPSSSSAPLSTPTPTPAAVGPGGGGTSPVGVAAPSVPPAPVAQPTAHSASPAAGTAGGAPAPAMGGPVAQRSVSAVDPDAGPLTGGTVITIRGAGLLDAVRVEVGGRPATALRVQSDSRLTAQTPAGARAGGVTVVVVMSDGGRYGLSPGFTYVEAPVLDSLSPDRGPASGGNTVVLKGEHFRRDAVVRFGTTTAQVRKVSETSIEVVVPAHLAGFVEVTVTTPGGTSEGRRYTYLPG